jgi:hypothetical protein
MDEVRLQAGKKTLFVLGSYGTWENCFLALHRAYIMANEDNTTGITCALCLRAPPFVPPLQTEEIGA